MSKEKKKIHGIAIVGIILGIIALIFCWVPVFGVILGILAVIFSSMGMKKSKNKGIAIAGLVIGIISIIIGLVITIVALAVGNTVNNFNTLEGTSSQKGIILNKGIEYKTSGYTLDDCLNLCDKYCLQMQTEICQNSCQMVGKEGRTMDNTVNALKNVTANLNC